MSDRGRDPDGTAGSTASPAREGLDVTAVEPGTKRHFQFPVGETYLGEPVEVPVTVLRGAEAGPTVFLSAAVHGDELNGVKVCQEVVARYDPADLHGTIVCLHVVNVPAFYAQQRDVPIYDQDLNRSFPGKERGNTAQRMARAVYEGVVRRCDLGIDFHTSTRNRTTMYHVRADLDDPDVERLSRAFGPNLVLYGEGDDGSLRGSATRDGIPTITVEMGRAHRFQPALIDEALEGVESVLAEYGLLPGRPVRWPGWFEATSAASEKRWLRADVGGLVERAWGPTPLVYEGDPICTITDHFATRETVVRAPFTGIVVGWLENPVALPGHPLCHLVGIDAETRDEIEREIERGQFDGYRLLRGTEWRADDA